MMWTMLAGILWVVSFITLPTSANGFWLPKQMAWLMGSFVLASSPWWNPPSQPTSRLPALGWLFCWVLCSFGWFVLWPQMTIPQAEVGVQRAVGMRWYVSPILPTLTWMGSFLAIDALVRHTDALVRWHRVALHLVHIGLIFSILVISHVLHLNPLTSIWTLASNSAWSWGPFGLLGNTTVMGNFLAPLVPLCLMFSAKRYRWGAWLVLLTATACTMSITSTLAAFGSSLVVLGLQRRWKTMGVVLMSTLLLGVLTWSVVGTQPLLMWLTWYINPTGRWQMWQTALTFWAATPLNAWIGYGAGSVGAATVNGVWDYGFLHNDYLEGLFQFGIIGATLALLAGWQALRLMRRFVWTGASTAWLGALLAYALLMMTSFVNEIGSCLMVGVISVAAVLSHCQPDGGSYAQG